MKFIFTHRPNGNFLKTTISRFEADFCHEITSCETVFYMNNPLMFFNTKRNKLLPILV